MLEGEEEEEVRLHRRGARPRLRRILHGEEVRRHRRPILREEEGWPGQHLDSVHHDPAAPGKSL